VERTEKPVEVSLELGCSRGLLGCIPSEAFPSGQQSKRRSHQSLSSTSVSLLFTNNQFSGYQMRPRFHLEELPQTFPPIFHKSLILSDMGFMCSFPAGPFGTEPNVTHHEIQAYLSSHLCRINC
jgi:hypothetical protein